MVETMAKVGAARVLGAPWAGIASFLFLCVVLGTLRAATAAVDTNPVYSPCGDTRVQILDGFTFGIVFNTNQSFYLGRSQLSPCDRRLNLYAGSITAFRPRVDEISLLTVNESSFNPEDNGGYMVTYAGSRYGARSAPHFVSDGTHTVTSFNLVLNFQRGRLMNMLWKNDDCKSCEGNSEFVCLKDGDCAVRTSSCRHKGGKLDCSLGFTVTFSGTDKNNVVMNTWYQVGRLHQYSLFSLFSNLKNSIYNQLFF